MAAWKLSCPACRQPVPGHYLLVMNHQVTCPACATPFAVKVQAAKPAGRNKARGRQLAVGASPLAGVTTYVYDADGQLTNGWSKRVPSAAPEPPPARKRPRRR